MALRLTDFLPTRFEGNVLDLNKCRAHYLSFQDYLQAHNLHAPADAAAVNNVVSLFRRTLVGEARIWIEDKVFNDLDELKTQFLARFSPNQSNFAKVREFEKIQYVAGQSAEQLLTRIRQAAQTIGYGEAQIANKFLASLPVKCQTAVIMAAPEDATANELAQRAQRFLDINGATEMKEVVFSNTVEIDNRPTESSTDKLSEQLQALSMKLDSDSERKGRRNFRSPRRNNRSKSRERRKPSRSNSRGRGRKSLQCYYCKKEGHGYRYCRKLQDDLKTGNVQIEQDF